MSFIFKPFILALALFINLSQAQNFCTSPWEKVNDDICILLNVGIKSWSHAKYVCNFNNGSLLFIQNENEQKEITNFIRPLVKFRFTSRPYIWLDSTSEFRDNQTEWKWSKTNKKVLFTNWVKNLEENREAKCACFKPKDGLWRTCDCLSVQHFICRKANPNTQIEETPVMDIFETKVSGAKEIDINNDVKNTNKETRNVDLSNEEKTIVVSTIRDSKSEPSEPLKQKSSNSFQETTNSFVNILRMKLRKSSFQFRTYECPLGFGYYSVDEDKQCSRYKICQNWDNIYAFLIINKCIDDKVFDFKKKKCVNASQFKCNPDMSVFQPFN